MHSTIALAVFSTALSFAAAQTTTDPVTGILGNATVITNNPPGAVYVATLPQVEFNNPSDPRGNIKGSVSAQANPDGIGVDFTVNFSNLPTSGGPFLYHIHVNPVPADGNCTGTLAHLDPYQRGETPACNKALPQTCQVGDLSGKYGTITSDPFTATYHDDFASTYPGIGAFFGNRSIVVHFGNKTRITCANFVMQTATTPANASVTTAPLQYTGTGAGNRNVGSLISLLAVMAFAFLLL